MNMKKLKCYDDAVCEILDEATKRFALSRLTENEKKRENIINICAEIDKFSEEFVGEEFFVKVDDDSGHIIMELVCEEIVIEKPNHHFYLVSMCAENIEFRCGKDSDSIVVSFTFPGIWE